MSRKFLWQGFQPYYAHEGGEWRVHADPRPDRFRFFFCDGEEFHVHTASITFPRAGHEYSDVYHESAIQRYIEPHKWKIDFTMQFYALSYVAADQEGGPTGTGASKGAGWSRRTGSTGRRRRVQVSEETSPWGIKTTTYTLSPDNMGRVIDSGSEILPVQHELADGVRWYTVPEEVFNLWLRTARLASQKEKQS